MVDLPIQLDFWYDLQSIASCVPDRACRHSDFLQAGQPCWSYDLCVATRKEYRLGAIIRADWVCCSPVPGLARRTLTLTSALSLNRNPSSYLF